MSVSWRVRITANLFFSGLSNLIDSAGNEVVTIRAGHVEMGGTASFSQLGRRRNTCLSGTDAAEREIFSASPTGTIRYGIGALLGLSLGWYSIGYPSTRGFPTFWTPMHFDKMTEYRVQ